MKKIVTRKVGGGVKMGLKPMYMNGSGIKVLAHHLFISRFSLHYLLNKNRENRILNRKGVTF